MISVVVGIYYYTFTDDQLLSIPLPLAFHNDSFFVV